MKFKNGNSFSQLFSKKPLNNSDKKIAIYTFPEQAFTTFLVLLVVGITCLLLLGARHVQEKIGDYGITIISKIMGLLLASYAIQSVLTWLKGFFSL